MDEYGKKGFLSNEPCFSWLKIIYSNGEEKKRVMMSLIFTICLYFYTHGLQTSFYNEICTEDTKL